MEDRFRRALDTLLGPMLGAGNYTVEVHADVDMSESQATRESFPAHDRALTSERITKSVSGTTPPAVGIPGALDPKRVVQGKRVSLRVDPGGRRYITQKTTT